MPKVAVGSDDLYPVSKFVVEYLRGKGFEVETYGALKTGKYEPWPRVAYEVAKAVADGRASFGVLICYTGTGVSIVANKVRGIRAALVTDEKNARGARLWNDANILVLSGRLTSEEVAKEIIEAWLSVDKPDPSELENIKMIGEIELEECKRACVELSRG